MHLPAALLLAAFALLTLFLSASVIFDLFGIRAREGDYVPLVVWANFLCSLAYLAAAYGLYRKKKWENFSQQKRNLHLENSFK